LEARDLHNLNTNPIKNANIEILSYIVATKAANVYVNPIKKEFERVILYNAIKRHMKLLL